LLLWWWYFDKLDEDRVSKIIAIVNSDGSTIYLRIHIQSGRKHCIKSHPIKFLIYKYFSVWLEEAIDN
jgi:hypothetical protein